ncbi:MAG: D-erythronate dehydrogenase [Pseudomonadota bacterium]
MHCLILGAAGMLGVKLASEVAGTGKIAGRNVTRLTLHDVVDPQVPVSIGCPVEALAGDLSRPGVAERVIAGRPDVIFHLAAIVSGEAEADFDKGYRINLDGTRLLLEAIRSTRACPRLVFASSIAVFGAPFPDPIPDDFPLTPLTSYGTQKAIGEALLADYTRKGFVDGIGLRLPTIVVRPGAPNKAASGFFSNIIREPLAGLPAILPVSRDVVHWMASPRSAVGFLVRAAGLNSAEIGPRRNLTMPGLAASVGEMIDALRDMAGSKVADLIREEPDSVIQSIVAGWPRQFEAARARDLGFTAETDFKQIIESHVTDTGVVL